MAERSSVKLLLDTHFVIWVMHDERKLSARAHALIGNPEHEPFFSVINLWEIAVKNGTKKSFDVDVVRLRRALLQSGYQELKVDADHAMHVGSLPLIHKDPFDRLLIAQSQVELMTFITVDAHLRRYPNTRFADI